MTLRAKLFATVLLVLAVGLGAFGWLASRRAEESLRHDLDARLSNRAFILTRAIFKGDPAIVHLDFDEKNAGLDFHQQSRSLDGELVWTSHPKSAPLPLSSKVRDLTPENRLLLETVTDEEGRPWRLVTAGVLNFNSTDRSLHIVSYGQAALPLRETEERVRSLHRWLWAGGLAAFLLCGAAAWLLLREWLAGFGALAAAARRLGADPSARERLPVAEGGGELAALARDVNALLDRLEASLDAQQRFTGDASHELRTPLAILRSELEVALRRDRTTAEYRDALTNCREESERLSRLVENLIALARADAGEGLGELEPVNLTALAGEFCERLRSVASTAGVHLVCHSAGPCEVRADRLAIERIFVNLIENAIRHTPRGESVEIRTRGEDTGVLVEVADRGPGVPPEHLPRIFDRFYRVDKARSQERGGAGLGLSIVKSLVAAHRGRVEVHGEFGHGATFRVWLPRG